MSTDPRDKQPDPEDKRRAIPIQPAEPTARLGATHRQMPQAPVVPQFSDQPQTPATPYQAVSRGCNGYTIAVLAMSLIVLSLVLLALFLPPFSLWNTIDDQWGDKTDSNGGSTQAQTVGGLVFTPLNYESPRAEADGLVITAAPDSFSGAFGVHITALSPADYLAENIPESGWFCETALPAGHALASPVYSLAQTGTTPAALTLQVSALPDAAGDPAALELDGWNATNGTWEFLAAGADETGTLTADLAYLPRCLAIFRETGSTRRAGVTLGLMDRFAPEVMAANVRLYPGSLRPTQTGALQVVLAPGFQAGQGYDVLPLLQNFDDPAVIDVATVQRILDNATLRTEHARQIAAFVLSDPGYTGIVMDYREIPLEQREPYTGLLRDLADLLHSQDRTLTVVLPVPAFEGDNWDTGAYDWPALGRIADEVVIMTPLDPQAYAPGGPVDTLLGWATTQISRGKLVLGLSALSVEDHGGGTFAPVTLADALGYLGDVALEPSGTVETGQTVTAWLVGVQAELGQDETTQTAYVRYLDGEGNPLRTMWLTGPDALYFRMAQAAAHNLGGVFVRDLMSPGAVPGVETALLAYRLDQPLETGPDAALEWVVSSGETALASDSGQPFTFQAGDRADTLTVEARVYGQTISSQAIRVSAPEPTVTPTLEPTATPTVTPEPTATPAPTDTPAPTSTPAPTATPIPTETTVQTATPLPQATTEPLPQPTAVSELPETPVATEAVEPLPGGPVLDVTPVDLSQPLPVVDPALLATATTDQKFEVGAQMGGMSSAVLFLGRMHAKWIKIDVRYLLGQDPANQQQIIDEVQANGFKILLNVVGDPFEFMGTDRATYIAAYTDYVGRLAANGADGIEVWREMNGRMTAEEYVQMLAYAYHAIKTARPDTMVISGALKPVAETDDLDENDSAYYTRLAAAGVAQYADCIGTQYVLGTVPPTNTSGDPRGDSAIYYLSRSSDGPRSAAGTTLPICYTRLGYLSPEGYPPLPEEYGWALNTTAAQQAQWLADAIRLSQEGTQVRLVIIWSLDAGYFGGGSPEAGYAIIRPDETCPACDLIEPLLKEPGT